MGALFRSRLVQSLCLPNGRISRADLILSSLATLTISVTVAFILVGGSFPNLSPWPSVTFVSLGLLILEIVFVVLEVSDFRKLSRNSQLLTEWLAVTAYRSLPSGSSTRQSRHLLARQA